MINSLYCDSFDKKDSDCSTLNVDDCINVVGLRAREDLNVKLR